MVRLALLAFALAACGKVTDPGAADAAAGHDAPADAAHLTKPVAAITSVGIAGATAQCTAATPSTGPGTISYVATWTIDGFPFTSATTTTIAGDTLPSGATHSNQTAACTLFAQTATETQASDPVSVTFKPRLAYTIDRTSQKLETIDLDTLAVTSIGTLNVAFAFGDLAWDASTQTLYMVDGQPTTPTKSLYKVDVTTGAATLVGVHGVASVRALAIDPTTHKLYAGTANTTNTLELANTTSGALTSIGGTFQYDGMAFDSKRAMMVGINANVGGAQLVSVDLSTGTTTALAAAGPLDNNGLTYDPFTDRLYAADNNGQIVAFDPTNGYSRVVSTTITGTFNALALALPPPQ